jgi:WD40 repeat protein
MPYDAFISYSHEGEERLAEAVQHALHQFARPWFRLRMLHVFRDKTTLSATPALWPSIEKALGESKYFLLIASPKAKQSKWVQREVDWWVNNRSVDRLFLLLSGGELVWNTEHADFDPALTSSLPPTLYGRFPAEPLWVDLRSARDAASLSLQNSGFRSAILDIAAPIHGKPKDELDGVDVREHRRVRRITRAVIAALGLLTVISAFAAWRALQNAAEARNERGIANEKRMEAEAATGREHDARLREADARKTADEQRNLAEYQRTLATNREAEAKRERRSAVARQLAAESQLARTEAGSQDAIELSTLLAVESLRSSPSLEGDAALRSSARLLMKPVVMLPALQDSPSAKIYPNQLALTPSGDHLIVVGPNSLGQAIDIHTWRPTADLEYQPRRTGDWLDTAGRLTRLENTSSDPARRQFGQTIVVYDAPDWKERARWTYPFDITALTADRDANRALLVTRDSGLKMVDLGTGRELFNSPGKWSEVTLSPDGRLWAARRDELIVVFETASNKELVKIPASKYLDYLAFSWPDGRYLARADGNRNLSVIDTNTGNELWSAVAGVLPRGLLFSPDGELLVAASQEDVRIFRADGRELRRVLQRLVAHMAFSKNGRYFAIASNNGPVRVFHLDSGEEILRVGNAVTGIAFSPDERRMVCALRDGTVDVVDIPDAHIPRMRSVAGYEIRKVAFSADARFIAIGSADSRVWIVDTNIDSLRVVMRHGTGITAIAFNNDGTRLAVGTESSPLMVIAVPNIAAIQRFSIDQIPYLAFAPSGDGLFVLSLNPGKEFGPIATRPAAGLFRISDVSQLPEHFSDNGRLIEEVLWSSDGQLVYLRPAKSDSLVKQGVNGPVLLRLSREVTEPVFSRTGEYFAIGSSDVRVYRPRRRQLIWTEKMQSFVRALAFSHDERFLAIARDDGTVVVVDAATGEVKCRVQYGSNANAVNFTPDNRVLLSVTGNREAVLRRAYLENTDLIEDACRRLTRNLRWDEWKRFLGAEPYRATCPALPAAAATNGLLRRSSGPVLNHSGIPSDNSPSHHRPDSGPDTAIYRPIQKSDA